MSVRERSIPFALTGVTLRRFPFFSRCLCKSRRLASPFCYLRSMTRAPSFAAVILAAGESSRMGRDKALLPWPPSAAGRAPSSDTFLSAAIRSLSPATDFVVVVVGKNEAALAPIIYAEGASLVVNPDTESWPVQFAAELACGRFSTTAVTPPW